MTKPKKDPAVRVFITIDEAFKMSQEVYPPNGISKVSIRNYAFKYGFGFQLVPRGHFKIRKEAYERWLHGENIDIERAERATNSCTRKKVETK